MALIQASVKLTLPNGKVVSRQSPTLLTTNNKPDYFTYKTGLRIHGYNTTVNPPTYRSFGYFITSPDLLVPGPMTIFLNTINPYPSIDKNRLDLGSCVIELGALVCVWRYDSNGLPGYWEPWGTLFYKVISGPAPNKLKVTFQDGNGDIEFYYGDEIYTKASHDYKYIYAKGTNAGDLIQTLINKMTTLGVSHKVKIEIGTW